MSEIDVPLQRQHALLARGVRPLDDAADQHHAFRLGRAKRPFAHAHALDEHRQGVMQEDGRERAQHHDDEGGRLQEEADFAALDRLAAEDGDTGETKADQASTIHASSLSRARNRAIAWPWSWQMRDSLTPNTSLISRRLSSCS